MGRKREYAQIRYDILKAIQSGISRKTRIMYKSNTSWRALQEILGQLIQSEMIRVEISHKIVNYYIANKGREYIQYYKKALELL